MVSIITHNCILLPANKCSWQCCLLLRYSIELSTRVPIVVVLPLNVWDRSDTYADIFHPVFNK